MSLRNLLEEEERPSFVLHLWACDCIERILGWLQEDHGLILEKHLRLGAQIVRDWIEGRRPLSAIEILRKSVTATLFKQDGFEGAHALRAMYGLTTPSWEQPRIATWASADTAKAPLSPRVRYDVQNALYIGWMTQAAAAQRPVDSPGDPYALEEEWQIRRLRDLDAELRLSRQSLLHLLRSYLLTREALFLRLQEKLQDHLYDG